MAANDPRSLNRRSAPVRGDDGREPAAAHRDGRGRGGERQLRAADRVERRIEDRGDRPAERHGRLPHAERPAAPGCRVRAEQRARPGDRHDRRAEAEDEEPDEERLLRAGERREREPDGADRSPAEHRAPRPDPVDEDTGRDQRQPRAEKPCREYRAELEEREVEVVEQLRPDRGEAEVHDRDRGLRGDRTGEHGAGRPPGECGHPQDYPWRVDRDAVARAGRRAQAEEALVFEREREAALRQQVAELVLEEEGARVDAAAFATLDEDEIRLVRAALGQVDEDDVDEEDPFADDLYVVFEDEPDEPEDDEDEASRLQGEIEESLRTQAALERFIAALDAPAPTEAR